jgi:hypothetical protein
VEWAEEWADTKPKPFLNLCGGNKNIGRASFELARSLFFEKMKALSLTINISCVILEKTFTY